ncbi:MAG: glycosyltransferase family 4 protein [Planctomycetes bacterium]|nr:glycosyltransferase family 4 protein [Planctomycetota bacterium]
MMNLLGMLRHVGVSPIIACSEDSNIREAFEGMGFKVYTMPMPWFTKEANLFKYVSYVFFLLLASYRISRLVRREGIEIIHANTFIANLYCIIPALITRRPLVWHMHDILEIGLFNRIFLRFSGLGASRIICVSEAVKKRLVEFGVNAGRCAVIYNSMTPAKYLGGRGRFRKELNIDGNVLLAGVIGFIMWWKGQEVFVRAIPAIARDFPDAKFVIVGDIIFDSDLLVQESGMGGKVVFTGLRTDIRDIMSDLDVVVHTSILPDPLPTVILEAMSVGRPVIASNIGGPVEIITSGLNGFLIPPNDPAELARSISLLFKDKSLRERMGREGAMIIEDRFRPEENLRKVKAVYMEVAASGRRTS